MSKSKICKNCIKKEKTNTALFETLKQVSKEKEKLEIKIAQERIEEPCLYPSMRELFPYNPKEQLIEEITKHDDTKFTLVMFKVAFFIVSVCLVIKVFA